MTAPTIIVETRGDIAPLLSELRQRLADMRPVLTDIGWIVQRSVIRNFQSQGRPTPWAPLKESRIKRRVKKGGGATPILRDTGHLIRSIIPRVTGPDQVTVGTNMIYAGTMQYGAKKGAFGRVTIPARAQKSPGRDQYRTTAKGRKIKVASGVLYMRERTQAIPWGDIPPRPFLMVQSEDWNEIKAAVRDYLA
ncbi:MAG: phage virion morphogenesis protein [Deltaproteobacteria bacterium]|nr:phage virion morphogenesis protein [Deltaproteobacteria bacterium]